MLILGDVRCYNEYGDGNMTFRKEQILYNSVMFLSVFSIVTGIVLMIFYVFSWFFMFLDFFFLVIIILMPKVLNEFITIDEEGISCRKKDNVLWYFNWDEIRKLEYGAHNKHRTVFIHTFDLPEENYQAPRYPMPTHWLPEQWFHLSLRAKQALAKYNPSDK